MRFRSVALMMFGLSFWAAQTKVAGEKPKHNRQAMPIPASLKAAVMDVYVVLDDGFTTLNTYALKAKTDKLKVELLLAEDGASASGEFEGDTKARFAAYIYLKQNELRFGFN